MQIKPATTTIKMSVMPEYKGNIRRNMELRSKSNIKKISRVFHDIAKSDVRQLRDMINTHLLDESLIEKDTRVVKHPSPVEPFDE